MFRHIRQRVAVAAAVLTYLVISLTNSVGAATSPAVTILKPLVQELRSPVRLALDAVGNAYVADTRNNGIVKFDQYGLPVQFLATAKTPQAVALAQDGRLLVSQGEFVALLNPDGSEAARLNRQFKFANGIAVDDVTGFIYVADSAGHEVCVFTASGDLVKRFGTKGKANGQFMMPTGLAFDKASRLLAVADTLNNRIQFFDADGVFKKFFGSNSVVPFVFASPQGVTFEYSKDTPQAVSRMYVVDTYQANVQVIDPIGNGARLYFAGTNPLNNFIGSYGSANGQLMVPSDVVFDQLNSRLLVANGFGNVAIFGIDGGVTPSDTTPPTLGIDATLAAVTSSSITITGTVEANATVTVTAVPLAQANPVVFTSATTWKCEINGLTSGDNTITATATDRAGNSASKSVSVAYLLPAPTLSIASSVPGLTNSTSLIISGTVEQGASVTVTNATTAVSGTAVVSGTTWTYPVLLNEGTNRLSVSASKPLSSIATVAADIVLDTAAPRLAVSGLANGSSTTGQVQNISGAVSDANTVKVLVNNQPATLVNGTFSAAVTLVPGANLVTTVATDGAGNSTSDVRTITLDAGLPVITVAAPVDNSIVANPNLSISGSVDRPVALMMVGGQAAVMDGLNWSAAVELATGLTTVEISATDAIGHTATVKRTIILDQSRPALAISAPAQDTAVASPLVTVSGSVAAGNDVSLTYSVNGGSGIVPVNAGRFSFDINLGSDGIYPLVLTAVDSTGKSTSVTRTIIVDTLPPSLTIDPATVPASRLTGTVEAGAGVVVKQGDVAIGTVTIANGTWTADLAGLAYDAPLTSVVATDAAGNSTAKSLTQALVAQKQ